MKKVWILVILVLVAIFGGRVWYLNKNKVDDKDVVKVGVLSYISGEHAELGKDFVKGIKLAVDEQDKHQVEILVEDSKTDAKTSIFAFRKLLSDKIQASIIVGDIPIQAILPIIIEQQIPTVVSIAGGAEFLQKEQNKLLVKNWPSIRFMGKTLGEYATNQLKLKKVAILASHNQYGMESMKGFKNGFLNEIVSEEQFKIEANDLKLQVSKIAYKKPDGIYLTGFGKGYISALKNIKEQIPDAIILTDTTILNPETYDNVKDLNNVYFVNSIYKENTSEFQQFKKYYQIKFNQNPSLFSAYGYDSMKTLFFAMEQGKTNKQIHQGLQKLETFDTFAGLVKVLDDGDFLFPLMIGKMKSDGTFEVLKEMQ